MLHKKLILACALAFPFISLSQPQAKEINQFSEPTGLYSFTLSGFSGNLYLYEHENSDFSMILHTVNQSNYHDCHFVGTGYLTDNGKDQYVDFNTIYLFNPEFESLKIEGNNSMHCGLNGTINGEYIRTTPNGDLSDDELMKFTAKTGIFNYVKEGFSGQLKIVEQEGKDSAYAITINTVNNSNGNTCSLEGVGLVHSNDNYKFVEIDGAKFITFDENNIIVDALSGDFCGLNGSLHGVYERDDYESQKLMKAPRRINIINR